MVLQDVDSVGVVTFGALCVCVIACTCMCACGCVGTVLYFFLGVDVGKYETYFERRA